MRIHRLSGSEWAKAIGVGVANAVLLSLIMVPATAAGLTPFPQPPSLAFAEIVLGGPQPVAVGLLFHLVYVTFWSAVFVVLFRHALTLGNALGLAFVLWILALVVFFPTNSWGMLGLGPGAAVPFAALVPHALFALFLWGLCRLAFGHRGTASPSESLSR